MSSRSSVDDDSTEHEIDYFTTVDSDLEDLEGPDDAQPNPNVDYKKIRPNVTWVLVNYLGNFFPGMVTAVLHNSYQVKCLTLEGHGGYAGCTWRFPDREDKILYRPSKIHSIIEVPTPANKRGGFKVPELDPIWN